MLGRWAEARLRQGKPEVALRDLWRADDYAGQAALLLGIAAALRGTASQATQT